MLKEISVFIHKLEKISGRNSEHTTHFQGSLDKPFRSSSFYLEEVYKQLHDCH